MLSLYVPLFTAASKQSGLVFHWFELLELKGRQSPNLA
jgi:hypothetical protein